MKEKRVYYKYSDFLKEQYKEKVYKLPINIPTTCPNRDGSKGVGGCYFCSSKGGVHDILSEEISVEKQIDIHKEYFSKRYKAKKYIAYFQSYTNTYLDNSLFEKYMKSALQEDIVEICIATRPDCVDESKLKILHSIKQEFEVGITIELGLQSVNEESLIKINRGHTVSDYLDAVKRIQKYGFFICVHIIANLPWDTTEDLLKSAKLFNEQKINLVKVHSLYIAKNTVFSKMYREGLFDIISLEEYKERVIQFLEYLSPSIAVERLVSSAPKNGTDFCNWETSRWKIRDDIVSIMKKDNRYQGRLLKNGIQ